MAQNGKREREEEEEEEKDEEEAKERSLSLASRPVSEPSTSNLKHLSYAPLQAPLL